MGLSTLVLYIIVYHDLLMSVQNSASAFGLDWWWRLKVDVECWVFQCTFSGWVWKLVLHICVHCNAQGEFDPSEWNCTLNLKPLMLADGKTWNRCFTAQGEAIIFPSRWSYLFSRGQCWHLLCTFTSAQLLEDLPKIQELNHFFLWCLRPYILVLTVMTRM